MQIVRAFHERTSFGTTLKILQRTSEGVITQLRAIADERPKVWRQLGLQIYRHLTLVNSTRIVESHFLSYKKKK